MSICLICGKAEHGECQCAELDYKRAYAKGFADAKEKMIKEVKRYCFVGPTRLREEGDRTLARIVADMRALESDK